MTEFRRTIAGRHLRAGLVALGAMLLAAGCADTHEWKMPGTRTTDADRLHPIGAEVRREKLDLPPAGTSAHVQSENYFAVTKFVRQYLRDGRGQIDVLISPRGSAKTRAFVTSILDANGVAPERVRYGTRPDGKSGALIAYTRIAAVAPLSCDDWSEDITRRVEQGVYANFGCASQRNLANMVADPTDLDGTQRGRRPTGRPVTSALSDVYGRAGWFGGAAAASPAGSAAGTNAAVGK